MGRSTADKKCDGATKEKLRSIHLLLGKTPHDSCSTEGKGLSVPIDGNRLNAYTDAQNINNIDIPPAYRFANKPHICCANMERTINKALKKYDDHQTKIEEEHFAKRYNLRSNPNFEEAVYVDDQFVAIEEEEEEEEEEAIDPPAGGNNNNNIGVDPPVGRDPPTGGSPINQPPTDRLPTPPPPDPPTEDHRKKPRKGKRLTLLKLIQD